MACVCCFYKNRILITAQVCSVITFIYTFMFAWWGPDICALLAMTVLLFGACCDMKAHWFHVAIGFSILGIIGSALFMIFWKEYNENSEDEDEDCDCWCTSKACTLSTMALALLLNGVTAALTYKFMSSPNGIAMHQANAATEPSGSAVSPAIEQDEEADKGMQVDAEMTKQ